jgi:FKBP-type peptidyl-prolyl cis-trans isomerase FklB
VKLQSGWCGGWLVRGTSRFPPVLLQRQKQNCNSGSNSDNMVSKNQFMRTTFFTAVFSLATASLLFADGTNDVLLTDDKSRLSYAIGMMFASRWKEQGVDVDNNIVLRGLNDGQSGGPTLMSQQEEHDIITKFQQALADRQQKMREEMLSRNKAEGDAFLAQNKNQPGVVVLPDGLQYKVITDGTGEMPSLADTVTVNYRGAFINGTEFDSSAKNGKPISFPLNHVIRGWSEALTHMKAGSKWQLFVPPDLAYGQAGFGSRIEPNATLVFEVELLSVQHPVSAPVVAPPPPMTSDIIKVPSAEEMKKGAKIETIKPEDVQKLQSQSPAN